MYVRLAFAVAAHLEPEILIVDEVLAVGDARFQKKCLRKMRDVSTHGRTILFVSHSMAAISALCTSAVLLRGGRLALRGETSRVVEEYLSERVANQSTQLVAEMPRTGSGTGRFSSLKIHAVDERGRVLSAGVPGCDVFIETEVQCVADFSDAIVAVMIFDAGAYRLIDINTALRGELLSLTRGQRAVIRFNVKEVLLKPGAYYIGLWLGRSPTDTIDYIESAGTWEVQEDVSTARHPQTFPGVYQCRFTHELVVHQPESDRDLQPLDQACPST
jgi:lipopolysaccharide transport system ATP-binding protein